MFVIRSLLCQSLEEAGGRVVLVTGCDTGIGHEVITSHCHYLTLVTGCDTGIGHEVITTTDTG